MLALDSGRNHLSRRDIHAALFYPDPRDCQGASTAETETREAARYSHMTLSAELFSARRAALVFKEQKK